MTPKIFKKNTNIIVLSFLLSFILVGLGHVILFSVVVYIFHLNSLAINSLKWFLIIMPGSIILASLLIHKRDNLPIRIYYVTVMIWLGWFFNFLIFLSPIVLLKVILKMRGVYFDASHYALLLFILATLFSALNVFNAFSPRVKRIAVKIKDLPEYWENKNVVMISDVHLGPIYRQKFLTRSITVINKLKPTAVFIAGDLFDGMETDFSWLHQPFKKLSAPQGVYYSIGNHDLYLGYKNVLEIFRESDIRVLNNERVIRKGLQIIGINYFKNDSLNLEKIILSRIGYETRLPSVLLWHEPKRIEQAKTANIDLLLSGHTHNGQLWPLNLVAKWVFKGYNYGLFQDKDFSMYVSSGLGTWGPPLRNTSRSEIVSIRLERK